MVKCISGIADPRLAPGARLRFASLLLFMMIWGCGEPEAPAVSEQDLYGAIARGDVRYVLLTKEDKTAEARMAAGGLVTIRNVEDLDALAAVLSKERVEFHLQQNRSVQMPE